MASEFVRYGLMEKMAAQKLTLLLAVCVISASASRAFSGASAAFDPPCNKLDHSGCFINRTSLGPLTYKLEEIRIEEAKRQREVFCQDETDLWKKRDEARHYLGVDTKPTCVDQLQTMAPDKKPEIVIVFENHASPAAKETRKQLLNDAIKHKLTIATEHLSMYPSEVSVARNLARHGFGNIPEKEGKPSFVAPDIQGIDDDILRPIWFTQIMLDNLRGRYRDGETMSGKMKSLPDRAGFLDDMVSTLTLRRYVSTITTKSDQEIADMVTKGDPSQKELITLWTSPEFTKVRSQIKCLANAMENNASIVSGLPNKWSATYSDVNLTPALCSDSSRPDDLIFEKMLESVMAIAKSKFPYSQSSEAAGLLGRDWTFAYNTGQILCDAIKRGQQHVVVNVGAAHAERTAEYLRDFLGRDYPLRFLNADTSEFKINRVYDRKDLGDRPSDYTSPTKWCRSKAIDYSCHDDLCRQLDRWRAVRR